MNRFLWELFKMNFFKKYYLFFCLIASSIFSMGRADIAVRLSAIEHPKNFLNVISKEDIPLESVPLALENKSMEFKNEILWGAHTVAFARILVDKCKVFVKDRSPNGLTLLHNAVNHGGHEAALIRYYTDLGLDINDQKNDYMATPLHFMASYIEKENNAGWLDKLKTLLACGCDITLKDMFKQTILDKIEMIEKSAKPAKYLTYECKIIKETILKHQQSSDSSQVICI